MPIPMWPKMEHSVGQEAPLVSAGRPLLHFLSTGARCAHASYTIPLNMIVRTTVMLFVNRLVLAHQLQCVGTRLLRSDLAGNALLGHILRANAHG